MEMQKKQTYRIQGQDGQRQQSVRVPVYVIDFYASRKYLNDSTNWDQALDLAKLRAKQIFTEVLKKAIYSNKSDLVCTELLRECCED